MHITLLPYTSFSARIYAGRRVDNITADAIGHSHSDYFELGFLRYLNAHRDIAEQASKTRNLRRWKSGEATLLAARLTSMDIVWILVRWMPRWGRSQGVGRFCRDGSGEWRLRGLVLGKVRSHLEIEYLDDWVMMLMLKFSVRRKGADIVRVAGAL